MMMILLALLYLTFLLIKDLVSGLHLMEKMG